MSERKQQSSQDRTAAANQPLKRLPEQGAPATLGQKVFMVVICLYMLSLVWLVLSHHWYGVLPKWLDPH